MNLQKMSHWLFGTKADSSYLENNLSRNKPWTLSLSQGPRLI